MLLVSVSVFAQTELDSVPGRSPVSKTLLFGWGHTSQLDTYLSPMEYIGWQVSLLAQSERMTHLANRRISFQSTFQGVFTSSDNPAGTAGCLGGRIAYDAGWHYHYSPLPKFSLKGGALVGADLGFLYNDRNGNNPAQGRIAADFSLSAGADYAFSVPLRKGHRLPMQAHYQADLPMIGLMFSPEFGESYYEISQYGIGHDIICSHPGNALSLRQLLTVDVCLSWLTLRVGYLCDIRQSNARSLRYHDISHSVMFGFVQHFQKLKRKNP